jgi:hypothetical protein
MTIVTGLIFRSPTGDQPPTPERFANDRETILP